MSTIIETPPYASLTEPELQTMLGGLVPALLARRGELLAVKDAASGRYAHLNDAMAQFLSRTLSPSLR